MLKNSMITTVITLLGIGNLLSGQALDASVEPLQIETCKVDTLPASVQGYCRMQEGAGPKRSYRIIRTDLNNDSTPEILLESTAVEERREDEYCKWYILRKAFNDTYVSIGSIGQPLYVKKRQGCSWNDIVGYGIDKADEKGNQLYVLYQFCNDFYITFVTAPASLSLEEAKVELDWKMLQENPEYNDVFSRMVSSLINKNIAVELYGKMIRSGSMEQRKELLERTIPMVKELPSGILKAKCTLETAQALADLKDYHRACEMYEEALASQLNHAPDEASDYADILNSYAVMLEKAGEHDSAEGKFVEAVKAYSIAASKDFRHTTDYVLSLANLTAYYLMQNELAQGEKNALEVVQLYSTVPPEKRTEMLTVICGKACGSLALIYEMTGRNGEEMCEKGREIFEEVDKPTTLEYLREYADFLYNMSNMHFKKGDMQRSLSEQKASFEQWNRLASNDNDYVDSLLDSGRRLANLLEKSGQEKQALAVYQAILPHRLELAKKHGGAYVADYVETLVETAGVFMNQQDYPKAQNLLEQPEKHNFTVDTETQARLKLAQATVHSKQGHFEKAAELLTTVKDTASSHVLSAAADYQFGRMYLAAKDMKKAEAVLLEGIASMKKNGGTDKWQIRCLNQLASIHVIQKNKSQAEKEYLEALAIYGRLSGGEAVETIHDYATGAGNLASLYRGEGRHKDAYGVYQKMLPHLQDSSVMAPHDRATVLRNMANTCLDMNLLAEAEDAYRKALAIFVKEAKDDYEKHEDVAEVHYNLGNLYRRSQQQEKAEQEFLEAGNMYHKVAEDTCKSGHYINESMVWNNLAGLYGDMNENEKAGQYYVKTVELRKQYAQNLEEREGLARAIFNLAFHYFKNSEFEKSVVLFAEGLPVAREVNKEEPEKTDLLLARFLMFHAAAIDGDGREEEVRSLLDEAESLLDRHANELDEKSLRQFFTNIKEAVMK